MPGERRVAPARRGGHESVLERHDAVTRFHDPAEGRLVLGVRRDPQGFARREHLESCEHIALALELEVVQPLVEATIRRVGALDRGRRLAVEPGDDGRGGARHAVAVADEVADQPLVQVLLGVIHKIDVGVKGHEQPAGAVDVPPVGAVRAPAGRADVGDDGVGPVAEDFIAVDGVAPQPFNAF